MIPSFNALGLLPPGVYSCNLVAFERVFAFNARRQQLFESLQRCLQLMHQAGLTGAVLLDGSYATDKENPADIELTLDVRRQPRIAQDKALIFYARSHAELDTTGIDWYPTMPDNAGNDFTMYFQYVGEKTAATKRCNAKDLKGILKLTKW